MERSSALDWSYDRHNYSLRLRQVAANQRSIVPSFPAFGPHPEVAEPAVTGDPGHPKGRPKSLQKQKKTLSRSNSSLDEEVRPALASRRDYGSTSSLDLLAKGEAADPGLNSAGPRGSPQPALSGPPKEPKGRSVHFKTGSSAKESSSSSSSLAFLKRLRHSGKSQHQHTVSCPGPAGPGGSPGGPIDPGPASAPPGDFGPGLIAPAGAAVSAGAASGGVRKHLIHFDCQSLTWRPSGDLLWRHSHRNSHRRRNTGASAASSGGRTATTPVHSPGEAELANESPGQRSASGDDHPDDCDLGDGQSNGIVLSCPFFRNELGGEALRVPCLTRYTHELASRPPNRSDSPSGRPPPPPQHCSPACNAASLLEPAPGRDLLGPDGRTPEEDEEEWGGGVTRHFWRGSSLRNGLAGPGAAVQNAVTPQGAGVAGECCFEAEFIDTGAKYYRKYFEGQAHQNWFGVDEEFGAIAVSLRRERLSGSGSPPPIADNDSFVALSCSGGRSAAALSSVPASGGPGASSGTAATSAAAGNAGGSGSGSHLWRLIVRTQRQLVSLRGAIFEEHVPTQSKLSASKGLPVREILHHVVPELPLACLRLGLPEAVPKVLKMDEQRLSSTYKVGVLLCRSGQAAEEEMYNNEHSSSAFEEFLSLIGQKVKLHCFDRFKGGLDNKTDMTGTHSYHANHQGNEIMFHVSTLLPFTPSNNQQLMRKRHIGNDIVTIIFQEPGALPFSPKTIRSQFQHIFIVVRAHDPNTEHTRYSVAMSRSCDVPPFGPPIPHGATFPKSQEFVDFLLTKVMNGENAAHRSPKFLTMALRSREDILKDLATQHVNPAVTLDSNVAGVSTKFLFGSGRKKDRNRGRPDLALQARGALVWSVRVFDASLRHEVTCFLAIGWDRLILMDVSQMCVLACLPCRSVIGWNRSDDILTLFYNEGELLRLLGLAEEDSSEIVQRLEVVSPGCHTHMVSLERSEATNLGFSVHDGSFVANSVPPGSSAERAGLRQGSRIVELCGRACCTLTSETVYELLRSASHQLDMLIIPPDANNSVRKGVDITDPFLTNRAVAFLARTETAPELPARVRPGPSPSRAPPERRHIVGAAKTPQRECSLGELSEVGLPNGDGTARGFQANLRRLIDPDFTEEDIRNKATSPSSVDNASPRGVRPGGPSSLPRPLQRTLSDDSVAGTGSATQAALPRLSQRVATEASLQQDWSRLVFAANQHLATGPETPAQPPRRPPPPPAAPRNHQGLQLSNNDLVTPVSPRQRLTDLEQRISELESQVQKERQGRQLAEEEVERLRTENAHLKDECSKAAQQLTKFSSWFFNDMDRQFL